MKGKLVLHYSQIVVTTRVVLCGLFCHGDLKLDSDFFTYNMFSSDSSILIVTNDQRHTSWTACNIIVKKHNGLKQVMSAKYMLNREYICQIFLSIRHTASRA